MQAITTKFLGPTNSRGSRIVAKCQAKRIFVNWDYSLDLDANHELAATELSKRLGWDKAPYGKMVGGALPDGIGFAFVFCK